MIANYLLDNFLPILIAFGGGIAWFFDKRKRDAETKSLLALNKQSEATALQGMQDVYDKFVDDVKKQIEDFREENAKLRKRVSDLEADLENANKERAELINKINKFQLRSEEDARLIASLKTKIESYEKDCRTSRKERI